MKRFFIFILLPWFFYGELKAQMQASVSSAIVFGGEEQTPFFIYSGQEGQVLQTDQFFTPYLFMDVGYNTISKRKRWTFTSKVSGYVTSQPDQNMLVLNQYYAAATYLGFRLSLGAESTSPRYGGLSLTNGDMLMSNNARPYPKVVFSTDGYIALPFGVLSKWIEWYAEYGEGVLNDDRYVDRPHLHQKKFHLKLMLPHGFSVTAGLDDYVMWGGSSPKYGELDESWQGYWDAIMGNAASSDGLIGDQMNVAGNHVGQHVFRVGYEVKDFELEGYYLHLFEDGSGKDFMNFPDGTWGVCWHKKKRSWLETAVVEWTITKDQSGTEHIAGQPSGKDNYFNHGVYASGWTYYGRTIGTPLMVPRKNDQGFASTRMEGLYVGLGGTVQDRWRWELRSAYWKHYRWYYKDDPKSYGSNKGYPKEQWSLGARVLYRLSDRWGCRVDMAMDRGDVVGDNIGVMFGVKYQIK
ncbi:capsule assembly Wzi family protein [Halosquirtibacter xylanolyticus]|uniref:capsule assembly Wzi family protein n=1 Tax=Halosquirtibacter xylanolyticus TaxID=3374599 RepID=UPI0037488441|nr:capsule assembly Wzi family protein [Prolixibacteraceae bacterium]